MRLKSESGNDREPKKVGGKLVEMTMRSQAPSAAQSSFLMPTLREQLDARQPLYQLAQALPWATFEEALEDAKKKFVGPEPNILALPLTFKKASVHLCMKDPKEDCMDAYGHCHPCMG